MNARLIKGHRELLLKKIHKLNIYKEGDFTLSSGLKSNYYIDVKALALNGNALYHICNVIDATLSEAELTRKIPVMIYDSVGGPIIGADPIVGALLHKNLWNSNLTGFLIRSQTKEYGTQKLIEGTPWGRTMLVEDVTTTGASLLHSIEELKKIGIKPQAIFTVVNRSNFTDEFNGIPFFSVFSINEIQKYIHEKNLQDAARKSETV